jgi:hypothetical protein
VNAPKLPRHARPVCTRCHATPPAAEMLFSRGAWWHRKCARVFSYVDGAEYVDFPSDGKIMQSTLISETE